MKNKIHSQLRRERRRENNEIEKLHKKSENEKRRRRKGNETKVVGEIVGCSCLRRACVHLIPLIDEDERNDE